MVFICAVQEVKSKTVVIAIEMVNYLCRLNTRRG